MPQDLIDVDSDRLRQYAAVLLDARVAKHLMSTAVTLNGSPANIMEMDSDRLRAAMRSINISDATEEEFDGAIFYTALRWNYENNTLIEVDPAEVWHCVVPPDTSILIDACGLAEDFEEMGMPPPVFFNAAGVATDAAPGALLLCTLDSQVHMLNLDEPC